MIEYYQRLHQYLVLIVVRIVEIAAELSEQC